MIWFTFFIADKYKWATLLHQWLLLVFMATDFVYTEKWHNYTRLKDIKYKTKSSKSSKWYCVRDSNKFTYSY